MTSSTTVATDFGLLEISGVDSERLLQGQLTCDVTQLTDTQWVFGACCSAKGRMVANFIIARQDQRFMLRLPQAMLDVLKQHLSKYAVFYKVSLEVLDWQRRLSHSSESQGCEWQDNGLTVRFDDGRQEFWSATDQQSDSTPETTTSTLSAQEWAVADIKAGIGWVLPESKEAWLPQHIGWHHLGGISFKKGCYTGQEVVARLQYLGKSKRQLVRIQSTDTIDTCINAAIHAADTGKSAGELVSWSGREGLAIIQGYPVDTGLLLENTPLSHTEAAFPDTEA